MSIVFLKLPPFLVGCLRMFSPSGKAIESRMDELLRRQSSLERSISESLKRREEENAALAAMQRGGCPKSLGWGKMSNLWLRILEIFNPKMSWLAQIGHIVIGFHEFFLFARCGFIFSFAQHFEQFFDSQIQIVYQWWQPPPYLNKLATRKSSTRSLGLAHCSISWFLG